MWVFSSWVVCLQDPSSLAAYGLSVSKYCPGLCSWLPVLRPVLTELAFSVSLLKVARVPILSSTWAMMPVCGEETLVVRDKN